MRTLAVAGDPVTPAGYQQLVAKYMLNPAAVEYARTLIRSRQYVLDGDWGEVQPRADAQNAYLERHLRFVK